jgi:tetratricopeptide (TPR) repeat protein
MCLLASGIIIAGVGMLACGPDFPNRLLLQGDAAVLSAPIADFRRELERFHLASKFHAISPKEGSDVFHQSAEVDLADLKVALAATPDGEEVLQRYARVRASVGAVEPLEAKLAAIPKGLPPEFDDYIRGLLFHHEGSEAKARECWSRVLSLPESSRRYRSVWAAFMLGKSYLTDDPDQAIMSFHKVRELADNGFSDTLGLAASSLGWEAKTELAGGHHGRALELYLEQLASGDLTALMSLRMVASRVAAGETKDLDSLSHTIGVQRVITAYLVSRIDRGTTEVSHAAKDFTATWLRTLEKSGVADVRSADRLAWAAYQSGDMAGADRWLKLTPADSPLGQWLRAKLLLRAGKLDEAATMLAQASRAFPAEESWTWLGTSPADESVTSRKLTLGEAGVILLARRQYTEALDALVRGGFWVDGSYVAERVLTVDELKAYVDRAWPGIGPAPATNSARNREGLDSSTPGSSLRHLLARRLARLERFDEADVYMPAELRSKLAELAGLLRDGRDQTKDPSARAASLWDAARITRADGMELIGTELAPDAAVYGGSFPVEEFDQERAKRSDALIVPAGEDELRRAGSNGPTIDRRFHYRFVAARLGWEAAELMPDQSDSTARVLCEAGTWIKNEDPEEADRFYKALVRRCGKTGLGAEADRRKWFPLLK